LRQVGGGAPDPRGEWPRSNAICDLSACFFQLLRRHANTFLAAIRQKTV
jgi:hypothetical protein